MGAWIRRLRLAAGMTQEALAMAIKVTPPTISMYESRRRAPGRYRCALLSAALGLDLPQTLTLLRKTSNEGEDDEG